MSTFEIGREYIYRCADAYNDPPGLRGQSCFDVRTMKVGKTNTLIVAPNDWSTLSNGTVDGRPSGLHRYVGEQRFVFTLLNVTDGVGSALDWDMETRNTGGTLRDLSGNPDA